MNTPISIAVIGVGGYAARHIEYITILEKDNNVKLSAVVVRKESQEKYTETIQHLKNRNVRIFDSAEALFKAETGKTDLIVIPSPIETHAPLSIAAMNAGFHVLCEKPAAGSHKETAAMLEASQKTNKICAIGFQNIFSPGVQKMKQHAVSGVFGKLVTAKTIAILPRTRAYYTRNSWAGKINFAGHAVFDSPLQNAAGHQLNTMLYMAGKNKQASAEITAVYGENYSAKPIESADTQYLRMTTTTGVVLHQYATHACEKRIEPFQEFFFENGKIEWHSGKPVKIRFFEKQNDSYSLVEQLEDTFDESRHLLYLDIFTAINTNKKPLASIENSWQQVFAVEKCFLSSGDVIRLPPEFIKTVPAGSDKENADDNTVICDIIPILQKMYEQGKSFAEAGIPWAKKGKVLTTDI